MAAEEQMLQLPFERLRHAWLESRPACEQRLDDLKRLRERLEARLDEMAKAISADFGNRKYAHVGRHQAEPPQVSLPPVTPPVVEGGRSPVSEVLPPAELKRLQDETAARSQEARRIISQLPSGHGHGARVQRIETFLKQSADAERRGDLRQASELAGRALVLARELKP